jgi:hypothetical protein
MSRKTIAAAIVLCAFAVAPTFVLAQDTTSQYQVITVMPEPERDYSMTIYNTIPVADQPGFISWLGGYTPDQQVMVVRTLHAYSLGGSNATVFTTDTTPDTAMPVFVNVIPASDQDNFKTFWMGMTPVQQTSFVTYARDIYPTTTTTTTTETPVQTVPPETTTTTTTETTGSAAQPFGITMAAAFVGYLPEAEHTAYSAIAADTPISELGGMDQVLSTLTAEQAGMVVHALASINAMGKAGAKPKEGMSDLNTKNLYLSQLPDADKQAFESMWSTLDDQQMSSLEQLCRDAFNGGMNDVGATATTSQTD